MPRSSLPPSNSAAVNPVAQVVVDSPLPHLDRVFDYAIPPALDGQAQPGVRVRVRFAGRLVDGWLVSRAATSVHSLSPLHAVVSDEQVLLPEILALCESVAARWSGVLTDVVRNAVPRRHARAEAAPTDIGPEFPEPVEGLLADYAGGAALIARARAGQAPRAIVTTHGDDPAQVIAEFAHAVPGTIVIAPDRAAVERVEHRLRERGLDQASWTTVLADDGPELRYRRWLRALRGAVSLVVGTRSAVFAPLRAPVAIVVWDEWDESMFDQHAPYWNVRDVAAMRSSQQGTALVYVGPSVSADLAAMMPWVAHVSRTREAVRASAPRVRSSMEDTYAANAPGRIPALATQVMRTALAAGPVAVLVARAGYQPRLQCDKCREDAVCASCGGPLIRTQRSTHPMCVHCGTIDPAWSCPYCAAPVLRAPAAGSERTAEELGRAFPGVRVRSSSGGQILREIDGDPAIVVATAGALPHCRDGYAAAVILDTHVALARPDLRAAEDAFARWCDVVSQVRAGGEVVIAAAPDLPAVQALIRHDPMGFAQRELDLRSQVSLPPAVRLALLAGAQADIDDLLAHIDMEGIAMRGPVPLPDGSVRVLLTVPRAQGASLAERVKGATTIRSSKRTGAPVNVRIDPRTV